MMPLYIIRVSNSHLDSHGVESGHITDAFVPVEAPNEAEACQRAVLWHGDNGQAHEDDDLQWRCDDRARWVTFKATKCLPVTSEEMQTFLSLTQGVSTAIIIGQSAAA